MEIPKSVKQQYSTVNKQQTTTVQYSSLTDVINDTYLPWYDKQRRVLGDRRFIELANKARAGSDTPKILFRWMLQHSELVR